MTNTFYMRFLLKRGDQIEDAQFDPDPLDFGGHLPAVGDRIVRFLRGGNEGYRVVERIFDVGSRHKTANLVVERVSMTDIERLPRFARK